jgi:hypothetical protein
MSAVRRKQGTFRDQGANTLMAAAGRTRRNGGATPSTPHEQHAHMMSICKTSRTLCFSTKNQAKAEQHKANKNKGGVWKP